MHLKSVSNGLGAPSLQLLLMAIRGELDATVSITADTGWELDKLWNTGRRSTAREYYDEVIVPLCKGSRVTPYFVRAQNKNGDDLAPLEEWLKRAANDGAVSGIPLYGSRGGQEIQTCTDKMKIRACRQMARRLGAKTNHNYQGIHFHEADRRTKGIFLRMDGKWAVYQTTILENKKDAAGNKVIDAATGKPVKVHKIIKWQTHGYPLVDLRMSRADVYAAVEREGIPYLISSECDGCPHKDLDRWERTTPETIDRLAGIEATFNGQKFLTDLRIPLKDAIAAMREKRAAQIAAGTYRPRDTDFGCKNDTCGL